MRLDFLKILLVNYSDARTCVQLVIAQSIRYHLTVAEHQNLAPSAFASSICIEKQDWSILSSSLQHATGKNEAPRCKFWEFKVDAAPTFPSQSIATTPTTNFGCIFSISSFPHFNCRTLSMPFTHASWTSMPILIYSTTKNERHTRIIFSRTKSVINTEVTDHIKFIVLPHRLRLQQRHQHFHRNIAQNRWVESLPLCLVTWNAN